MDTVRAWVGPDHASVTSVCQHRVHRRRLAAIGTTGKTPAMLTPAEELGLAGKRLSTRVRTALQRLPGHRLAELTRAIERRARAEHLWYLRDGRTEVVRVLPRPLTALPEQMAYVHAVTLTVHRALKHLPGLYFADSRVRDILRLPDAEEAWLRSCWGDRQRELNPVFGRLDAVVDFTDAHWKQTLFFLEPNMAGIGGLHMLPACERVVLDTVGAALADVDPGLTLTRGPDVRDLLTQYLLDHLDALGRPGRTLCFLEPKYAGEGPEEQAALAAYLHAHYDIEVLHADPSELSLVDGEVRCGDRVVDVAYRDYSVTEILDLQREGIDIEPMRLLLSEDRMVSSIAAELDQKACWEVFTDHELVQAHFSAEERQVFRRHVLWTRVVGDRQTTMPDGGRGPLLAYAREARETLVLKPNRGYGGQGIVLGPATSADAWEAALDRALRAADDRWVLQALAPMPVHEFPVLDDHGRVGAEPFYTVYGFSPTSHGVAALGRASQKQVVNVAQRGGLFALLLGRAS